VHVCPFDDHIVMTREALRIHLWDRHHYYLVTDCGKDWAVSSTLKCKLEIRHSCQCGRQPCQEKDAVGCTSSTMSGSTSVHVSADMADKTVLKDQSSASQPCLKTASTSTDVAVASAVVSSAQDVTVASFVVR